VNAKMLDRVVPVKKPRSELVSLELEHTRKLSFHLLSSYPTFLLESIDFLLFT
jgi:hypothetical protein